MNFDKIINLFGKNETYPMNNKKKPIEDIKFNKILAIDTIVSIFDNNEPLLLDNKIQIQEKLKDFINELVPVTTSQIFQRIFNNFIQNIHKTNTTPRIKILALKLRHIESDLFGPKKPTTWTELPPSILTKIFSFVPPRPTEIDFQKLTKYSSGLKELLLTSKKFTLVVSQVRLNWMREELIDIKISGPCTSLEEAINLISKNNLSGANLTRFPDLTNEDLEKLFRKCPNLKKLIISSQKITYIPERASQLNCLICSRCFQLAKFPKNMRELEILDMSWCSLTNLSTGLPKLKKFNCSHSSLKNLPNQLLNLTELYCNDSTELSIDLSQMPKLQVIDYHNCRFNLDPEELPKNCVILE